MTGSLIRPRRLIASTLAIFLSRKLHVVKDRFILISSDVLLNLDHVLCLDATFTIFPGLFRFYHLLQLFILLGQFTDEALV